jgi:hypothetical protein
MHRRYTDFCTALHNSASAGRESAARTTAAGVLVQSSPQGDELDPPAIKVSGPTGVAALPQTVSDRIKIARTLCIFFMTFVHVQAGIAENVYAREAGFFDIVYFILTGC